MGADMLKGNFDKIYNKIYFDNEPICIPLLIVSRSAKAVKDMPPKVLQKLE
jgi:hypothetical protein